MDLTSIFASIRFLSFRSIFFQISGCRFLGFVRQFDCGLRIQCGTYTAQHLNMCIWCNFTAFRIVFKSLKIVEHTRLTIGSIENELTFTSHSRHKQLKKVWTELNLNWESKHRRGHRNYIILGHQINNINFSCSNFDLFFEYYLTSCLHIFFEFLCWIFFNYSKTRL